ncbi:thioredoxin family protein [Halobacillus litoralis]|uniref:thioredoxin family protein n=1 Tax=Halobacillus litoralis TaxID=45668 RepID=UPI001CFEF724|nr:thioredoxin family protein [Halobacillus litoralis]WLR49372.1 thioredoxin family protein [Halobacillus litoralis]
MQEIKTTEVKKLFNTPQRTLIFVHSPFCATCHLARQMLTTLEAVFNREVFMEMNASLHPEWMQHYKIKSVPCLLVTSGGEVEEKIYAFHSVSYMYEKVVNFVE